MVFEPIHMAGEFLGTLLLILLGNGVVANVVLNRTKGNAGGWIVITAGWAMGVYVGVVCSAPLSGAHLNPAVSVGLALAGKFAWAEVVPYIISQLAGAFVGTSLVLLNYLDHYRASDDPGAKQATFCTAPAVRNLPVNLLCEVTGTFVLVITVLLIAEPVITLPGAQEGVSVTGKVGLGSLGALPVALLVFGIGLSLGGTTGYAINPARDLGPRLAHAVLPVPGKGDSGWGYAWVPVVGPVIGAAIAVVLHNQLF